MTLPNPHSMTDKERAALAYPTAQREADAESHILVMAAAGHLETPISAKVAETYGVPHMVKRLKELKAQFRNELSFGGEGK